MTILRELLQKKFKKHKDFTFLIKNNKKLNLSELLKDDKVRFKNISAGDIVALIGDFDKTTIKNLIYLIDKKTIVLPLTKETRQDHNSFFRIAQVDFVIQGKTLIDLKNKSRKKRL